MAEPLSPDADAAAGCHAFVERGTRIGVDVGKARVGVAKCDPDRVMATPLETLQRDKKQRSDLRRIAELAHEYDAVCVYVGLPVNLEGEHTPSTKDALRFARQLERMLGTVPVRLLDERLSTVSAQRQLHEAGRTIKSSRSVIDQAAAVEILENALDAEKRLHVWAGQSLAEACAS